MYNMYADVFMLLLCFHVVNQSSSRHELKFIGQSKKMNGKQKKINKKELINHKYKCMLQVVTEQTSIYIQYFWWFNGIVTLFTVTY